MCGLCGLFGSADHWSDLAGSADPDTRQGNLLGRRQERLHRVKLLRRVLRPWRLQLDDWQGSQYLLQGPTGKSELVDHLMTLWPAMESVCGHSPDPLDPAFLDRLEHHD